MLLVIALLTGCSVSTNTSCTRTARRGRDCLLSLDIDCPRARQSALACSGHESGGDGALVDAVPPRACS